MKPRGPYRHVTPRRPTPLVVPLVDILPSRSDVLIPEWLRSNDPAPTAPSAGAPTADPGNATEAAPPSDEASLRQVLEDARAAAEQEGFRSARDRIEEIMARYVDAIDRLQQAIAAARPSPEAVVDLALVVATEIIGREATIDRDLVVRTVDEAIAQLRDPTGIKVRLGVADYRYVVQRRADLAEAGVTFEEDPEIGIGGCVVETPLEVRDSTVEARLAAVRQGLVELVRNELQKDPDDAES